MNSGDTFQLIQSLLRGPMDWLRDKSILPRKIQPSQSSGDVLFTDSDGVAKWGTTGSSAPAGPAGGVLSGSYPNPGFAVDMATQAELDGVQSVLQAADATEAAARLLADSDIYGSVGFALSEKSDYDHTHYLGGDLSGTPETATVSLFNGQLPSYYLSRANHTGTQLASTVSDFTTAVQAIAVGGDLSGTVGNATVSVSSAALYAASAAFDYGLSEKADYDHTHYLGGDLTGTPENASLTTAAAYAAQVTLDLALSEKAEYEHTHYLGTQLRGTPEDSHIVPGTTPGSILQTPGTVWDVAVWDESLWDGADPVWVDPYFAKFVTSDQLDYVLSEKADYDFRQDPVSIVATLPTTPQDGTEVYYLADATNGVVWHLKYRAAESGPYKWYYVGGPPLSNEVQAEETSTTASYIALATSGPAIALPLSGDYIVGIGCFGYQASGTAGGLQMSYDIGVTGAVDTDSVTSDVVGMSTTAARYQRKTSIAASTLTAKYKANTFGTCHWKARWISATPVRVG